MEDTGEHLQYDTLARLPKIALRHLLARCLRLACSVVACATRLDKLLGVEIIKN